MRRSRRGDLQKISLRISFIFPSWNYSRVVCTRMMYESTGNNSHIYQVVTSITATRKTSRSNNSNPCFMSVFSKRLVIFECDSHEQSSHNIVCSLISGWLGAMSTGVALLVSPVTIAFCRRKSTRVTAVLGGLVTALGCLFTSFASQFHQLFFSYGTVVGE
jgi:hypothetical protein